MTSTTCPSPGNNIAFDCLSENISNRCVKTRTGKKVAGDTPQKMFEKKEKPAKRQQGCTSVKF